MARRRKTQRNPRRGGVGRGSFTSDGFQRTAALSQVGQAPSTTRNIYTSRPTLQAVRVYPSGEPFQSVTKQLEPVYVPAVTQTEGPRIAPPSPSVAQTPPGYLRRGTGYSRISLASQPGAATAEATLMKQLIDPQLWRLADGGDRWAMHELQRRGPAHYRPARPNPRARRNPSQRVERFYNKAVRATQNPSAEGRAKYCKYVGTIAKIHVETGGRAPLHAMDPRVAEDVLRMVEKMGGVQAVDNPRVAAFVSDGYGLRARDLTRDKARLPSRGSGSRGGYTPDERKALPAVMFLKPSTRSWPVADEAHFVIALQYMTRGFGSPGEYPKLLRRLAKLWPVAQHRSLWAEFTRLRPKIVAKAPRSIPTLAQLRRV